MTMIGAAMLGFLAGTACGVIMAMIYYTPNDEN